MFPAAVGGETNDVHLCGVFIYAVQPRSRLVPYLNSDENDERIRPRSKQVGISSKLPSSSSGHYAQPCVPAQYIWS